MTIEVLAVRDPDGPVTITVFVDGHSVEFEEFTVDAGAGHDVEDWTALCEEYERRASSDEVRAAVMSALDDPPGEEYITTW